MSEKTLTELFVTGNFSLNAYANIEKFLNTKKASCFKSSKEKRSAQMFQENPNCQTTTVLQLNNKKVRSYIFEKYCSIKAQLCEQHRQHDLTDR
jgi:hypothetical protein